MARIREFGNDISGSIVTTGSATAYAITTGQDFTTLAGLNGQCVAFCPHATNGATVTLNCDGLGAMPLRSSPGVELQSGALIAGTPYAAVFNNSDGTFYLFGNAGIAGAASVPIGTILPYGGTTAPNSCFALCAGQAISRTAFPALFSLFGTTYGAGDGSTTFNIMDLRGRAVFGRDNMGGSAANRITVAGGNFDGTVVGGTGGAQNHTLTKAEIPTGLFTFNAGTHSHNIDVASTDSPTDITIAKYDTRSGGIFQLSTSAASSGDSITDHAGGGAHTILPPAIVLPFILRVI